MRRPDSAFSLMEMLAVLAIVSVMLALFVPGVATVRASVAKAKTKAMFGQWTLACAAFRMEYGRPPGWGVDARLESPEQVSAFLRALTGKNVDGSVVADASLLGGNQRRLAFLVLGPTDLQAGRLVDAFGNTDFGALVDRDGDGWVRPGVDGPLVAVRARDAAEAFVPPASLVPAEGVRAEAIFYSAGRGRRAEDLVLSWR